VSIQANWLVSPVVSTEAELVEFTALASTDQASSATPELLAVHGDLLLR